MKADQVRKIAAAAGHQLEPFHSVPMGVGPVATCDCGLGVTQPRRRPFRGQTWVWRVGREGTAALDPIVRVILSTPCPFQGLPVATR